jgi:creatinine amidohydrolase
VDILTAASSPDEAKRGAQVAVLPIGSFEQHGQHLPLITDTVVAASIASSLALAYDLFLLPPLTISCSHEHGRFPGTVSIRSRTMHLLIEDIRADLARAGVTKLVLVNGHGGNYVLSNIVQEANVEHRRMILFPGSTAWAEARIAAGCTSTSHADMHGGEAETSLLLHASPHLVRDGWRAADWQAEDRPDLLLLGVDGYTSTGVIGTPSAATPDKGRILIESLTASFAAHLKLLDQGPPEGEPQSK